MANRPNQAAEVCSPGAAVSLDRKALVVDDDAGIRLLLRRILVRNQFEVDLACDGGEALEKILTKDYAVIVLDVMMPRVDGRAVVHFLQEHAPDKLDKVIVMSAFGSSVRDEVCPPVGRFVEKPFDINHLLQEVTDCYWTAGANY